MTESLRDYLGALEWFRAQAVDPTQSWEGLCQKDVRTSYGIPSLFGTAWLAWLGANPDERHPGTDPARAPLGTALYYKGSNPAGHVMLAARPFTNGTPAAWSNDLVVTGRIDKVARIAPTTAWGQKYVGYLTAINHVDLRLQPPPQTARYATLLNAIDNLKEAAKVAHSQGDDADVKVLTAEAARLRAIYNKARHY